MDENLQRMKYFIQKYGRELPSDFRQEIALLVANPLSLPISSLGTINLKREANVMTAYCFRNTVFEDYHTDGKPIDDKRMKKLMVESSQRLAQWLTLKHLLESNGDIKLYHLIIGVYESIYTKKWKK